jgi:hypothetical protein
MWSRLPALVAGGVGDDSCPEFVLTTAILRRAHNKPVDVAPPGPPLKKTSGFAPRPRRPAGKHADPGGDVGKGAG